MKIVVQTGAGAQFPAAAAEGAENEQAVEDSADSSWGQARGCKRVGKII
jgi:hypothetical protein